MHQLPLAAFGVDLREATDEDPVTPDAGNQEHVVDASRATLRTASADLEADATAFQELREVELADAARLMASVARGLAEARTLTAVEVALQRVLNVELDEAFCESVVGTTYFIGYIDGWLGRDRGTGGSEEYYRGFDKGFEEGWRDEVEISKAQELRDGLDAVLSAAPGTYDGITNLRDSDIDLVGTTLCKGARRAAPLNRRESRVLSATLIDVFELSPLDAGVASAVFLSVYCLRVILNT